MIFLELRKLAMAERILHFTFGPVQSFVAQARRTRDLWAGSFLLSYLSGHAMKVVLDVGGKIAFPTVVNEDDIIIDPLLKTICNLELLAEGQDGPAIGSLPNRFRAELPANVEFDPNKCADAVKGKWKDISEVIWEQFLKDFWDSDDVKGVTRKIWERQVAGFWDINWVIGDSGSFEEDSMWLNFRKNWRNYHPPTEGGNHCTLMGDWQELSGFMGETSTAKKTQQKEFWERLRNHLSKKLGNRENELLELDEHERLCSIAFIKRFFASTPEIARKAIGWDPDVKRWPSTNYIAAADWLAKLNEKAREDTSVRQACEIYAGIVKGYKNKIVGGGFGERKTTLGCLQELGEVTQLDGALLFQNDIDNKNTVRLHEDNEEVRKVLKNSLTDLQKKVGSKASPYYALLLMDGDKLGKLLQNDNVTPANVSKALAEFTEQAPKIIEKHCCGVTIYAGGDDIMALLPINFALPAAVKLYKAFGDAFTSVRNEAEKAFFQEKDRAPKPCEKLQTTLSGAIVFANSRLTLRSVIKKANHLLKKIAKEQNNRNSIAIKVATGGQDTLTWVSTWEDYTDREESTIPDSLTMLADTFAQGGFSNQFFFKLSDSLRPLLNTENGVFNYEAILNLLKLEYQKSKEQKENVDDRKIEEYLGDLLNLCRERVNKTYMQPEERKIIEQQETTLLQLDGAMLVRFLGSGGLSHA